jgi:hypothetical protein
LPFVILDDPGAGTIGAAGSLQGAEGVRSWQDREAATGGFVGLGGIAAPLPTLEPIRDASALYVTSP